MKGQSFFIHKAILFIMHIMYTGLWINSDLL